jgi:hypothetical protein
MEEAPATGEERGCVLLLTSDASDGTARWVRKYYPTQEEAQHDLTMHRLLATRRTAGSTAGPQDTLKAYKATFVPLTAVLLEGSATASDIPEASDIPTTCELGGGGGGGGSGGGGATFPYLEFEYGGKSLDVEDMTQPEALAALTSLGPVFAGLRAMHNLGYGHNAVRASNLALSDAGAGVRLLNLAHALGSAGPRVHASGTYVPSSCPLDRLFQALADSAAEAEAEAAGSRAPAAKRVLSHLQFWASPEDVRVRDVLMHQVLPALDITVEDEWLPPGATHVLASGFSPKSAAKALFAAWQGAGPQSQTASHAAVDSYMLGMAMLQFIARCVVGFRVLEDPQHPDIHLLLRPLAVLALGMTVLDQPPARTLIRAAQPVYSAVVHSYGEAVGWRARMRRDAEAPAPTPQQ